MIRRVEAGEFWAYRARAVDPLVQIEVRRVGTQRPQRVLVRYVDDTFEGREEWVPPSRLKVLWNDVVSYIEREERWNSARGPTPARESAEEYAADRVFEILIDSALAGTLYGRDSGLSQIKDVEMLAKQLGVDADALRSDPRSFVEDDVLVVPWPVTEMIARRAAEQDPEPILASVERDEADLEHDLVHGRYYPSRSGPGSHISPEIVAEVDDGPIGRGCRDVLRQWCGRAATERRDELAALRTEVRRLGQLVEEAITELRSAGRIRVAARLEDEVGVPLEQIRAGRRPD